MIQISGTAVIEHRDSGEIYEISSDDLQFEDVSTHERDMGPEVLWTARIDHPELGELEWSVTEYPAGAISGTPEADVNGHELQTDFHFEISFPEPDVDPDDYDVDDHLPSPITDGDAEEMREWFLANYEDPQIHSPIRRETAGTNGSMGDRIPRWKPSKKSSIGSTASKLLKRQLNRLRMRMAHTTGRLEIAWSRLKTVFFGS